MALTPSLKSIEDIFGKLEREAYRAYHARKEIHKADHFYNFCVTAHSMKDYFFEHKGIIEKSVQRLYRDKWNKDKFLVSASEIANTSKHFTLRDPRTGKLKEVKTKTVEQRNSGFVEVWIGNGTTWDKFVELPDLIVTLENGGEFALHEFTGHARDYWVTFLRSESIEVRQQTVSELLP